ncbi:MAG TPA: alkaline phosphatase [Pseudomonadales bacterium]|nr:alkaline phosphatase [Pseudomonadales bacterium]
MRVAPFPAALNPARRVALALPLGVLMLTACAAAPTAMREAAATGTESARDEASPAFWRRQGEAAIAAARQPLATGDARNVILFVGDGMGVSTVTAARILDGQLRGGSGEENLLAFERFPRAGLSRTYNTNQQTPDSAGTMSAMITGVKTKAGVLSIDASAPRGDCAASLAASVPTLIERAEDAGLATGVVSTARITHATPAATYAHTPERDWEADSSMPPEALAAGCTDIAAQLLSFDHGDGIEVVLGGGRAMFLTRDQVDPEYAEVTGHRTDGRDLTAEWQTAHPTGHYLWNQTQFAAVPADGAPVLGLFEPSHMQFEADRGRDPGGEPSLAEMTAFAIERLQAQARGFVLVVEAGRIDHGHHAANAYRALTDTIALSEAVTVAQSLTSEDDTLILVTADHSHTLTIAGYPTRGNPILGLVVGNDEHGAAEAAPTRDGFGVPYTTLAYANGPGNQAASEQQGAGPKRLPHFPNSAVANPDGRSDLGDVDTTDPMYLQEGISPMTAETHGGEDVPVYAQGPGAGLLGGVIEQNVVYYILEAALGESLSP